MLMSGRHLYRGGGKIVNPASSLRRLIDIHETGHRGLAHGYNAPRRARWAAMTEAT